MKVLHWAASDESALRTQELFEAFNWVVDPVIDEEMPEDPSEEIGLYLADDKAYAAILVDGLRDLCFSSELPFGTKRVVKLIDPSHCAELSEEFVRSTLCEVAANYGFDDETVLRCVTGGVPVELDLMQRIERRVLKRGININKKEVILMPQQMRIATHLMLNSDSMQFSRDILPSIISASSDTCSDSVGVQICKMRKLIKNETTYDHIFPQLHGKAGGRGLVFYNDETANQAIAELGRLQFYKDGKIRCDDREIRFNSLPQPFGMRLLMLFFKNSERIFSHKDLYSKMAVHKHINDEKCQRELVKTRISDIRKPFTEMGYSNVIETVIGVGYRLGADGRRLIGLDSSPEVGNSYDNLQASR